MAVTLNALTTGVGGLQTTGDTSGSISLQSNGSTVLAVTSAGVSVTGTLSSSTAIPVTSGGTGVSTLTTAYGVLAAGTTATGALQNIGTGTTNQVLTSNGPGVLPILMRKRVCSCSTAAATLPFITEAPNRFLTRPRKT